MIENKRSSGRTAVRPTFDTPCRQQYAMARRPEAVLKHGNWATGQKGRGCQSEEGKFSGKLRSSVLFLPARSLRHHPTLSRVRIVHFKMSHQLVEVGGAY